MPDVLVTLDPTSEGTVRIAGGADMSLGATRAGAGSRWGA
jgi:hypothetical protein